eukprot:m.21241 g.21241  ORF g.21241 m.21241 type:complete len:671 (+) comp12360_c0_seq2:148-2160(+)
MAGHAEVLSAVLSADVVQKISDAKILVVGAGGIGCELLKNLAMCGFGNVELIDLDTIDVTNLNRQFLFQREHVGKSKAIVAGAAIRKMNPSMKINAVHGNIMEDERSTKYFEQFTMVLNALDNIAARNHVNRMCLAAKVPLVESGTAGYVGQVNPIVKGTECYECTKRSPPKRYPVCTIRNTPSLPIHCIVWAKFLFSQLFGVPDDENDVTPDSADPELATEKTDPHSAEPAAARAGGRVTVRHFAEEHEYNAHALFKKLFSTDVDALRSMEKLWVKRTAPVVVEYASLTDEDPSPQSSNAQLLPDQQLWSLKKCADVFMASVDALALRLRQDDTTDLEWDKDDEDAMNFVTATSNLRAHVFGIPRKSHFETKSMAGKIIPAIATTNAIVAGLIVIEALKILQSNESQCRNVYLSRIPGGRGRILSATKLNPPNPDCFVCREQLEVYLRVDTSSFTVEELWSKVLMKHLGMKEPEVSVEGSASEIISSDPEDLEMQKKLIFPNTLSQQGIKDGARLMCGDDFQKLEFRLVVAHATAHDLNAAASSRDTSAEEVEFEVVGTLPPQADQAAAASAEASDEPPSQAEEAATAENDDDDIVMVTSGAVALNQSTAAETARQRDASDHVQRSKRERPTEMPTAKRPPMLVSRTASSEGYSDATTRSKRRRTDAAP